MACDLISAEYEVDVYRKQLRASRAAFHAIVDRIADGVIVVNTEGTIAFVNPAAEQLLGRPAGELYGEPFQVPLTLGEASEIDLLNSDGAAPRVAELRVAETEWQNRSAYLVTLRDVTDHKLAERRARDAVRRRDEFLALLSHELRNPLAAIRNAAHVLTRAAQRDATLSKPSDVIERQCHQMARLLDDLLEVSRISQGKIQLRCETIDLRDVVSEAVEAMTPEVESRGQNLEVDLPDSHVWVQGDPARLNQVLTNLVANAAKFTNGGGIVQIGMVADGDEAIIRVTDNGIGIPADMLTEIFEPFIQGDANLARCDTGLGLGLSLVRTLVELHGGSVRAASEGPGRGSEFVLRLPVVKRAPVRVEPACDNSNSTTERLKLLIVEDNLDVREMLQTLLELDGHDVATAADGGQAVDMIDSCRPQVAIVDIGLPVLDGYEVARRVRAEPANADVFLIALTGYGQAEDRRRAEAAGFDAHLVKPVDLKRLYQLLAERRSPQTASRTCGVEKTTAVGRLTCIPGRGVVSVADDELAG